MNKYDQRAKCVKCGCGDVGAQYHEDTGRGCHYGNPCFGYGVCAYKHILRHCRNCHFEWVELPLDSEGDGE